MLFGRITNKFDCFVYDGVVNRFKCKLEIDTGSDIPIENPKFVNSSSERIPVDFSLEYPTAEGF